MLRTLQLLILTSGLLMNCSLAVAAIVKTARARSKITFADLDKPSVVASPWSVGLNYGVSTDLAEPELPRLYYQGLGINVGYTINSRWSLNSNLSGSFTTIDGQIDKRQEETRLESAGINPGLGINYLPGVGTPWFLSLSATALLDSASQREGYIGISSLNGGATWSFFNDRFSMTHSLGVSELLNTYDYSSAGTANPGTSFVYGWSNVLKVSNYFSLGTGFGIKQTRYLDGFWDYSYSTSLSATVMHKSWSMSLATSNGGYTDDGRVSLWYIDQYRRLVSLSMAYQF